MLDTKILTTLLLLLLFLFNYFVSLEVTRPFGCWCEILYTPDVLHVTQPTVSIHCVLTSLLNVMMMFICQASHAGSGVVRIDPLLFLARCRKRQLN